MGVWGFGLYQNDTSSDVKDAFEQLFRAGKSVREITDTLMEDDWEILNDPEEAPLFWLALADTQWEYGVLLPDVKEAALLWIGKTGSAPNRPAAAPWQDTLNHLREKLLSPQPPEKRPAKKRTYTCRWNMGDVFAWRLESGLARERGLFGRYFLIRKVDERVWYPGHIVPVVYVKLSADSSPPSNVEEYNRLEYVQTWFTRYEERFFPIDMRRPEEDMARKSRIRYERDEYGFLPQYRAVLLNTAKKVIPEKLIYIGNFSRADPPEKEFVPHSNENIVTLSWKNGEFETKLIEKYCGHNRRELPIYNGR